MHLIREVVFFFFDDRDENRYILITTDSLISGHLTSFEKNSREALISKEPSIIVEKLSVNSRCSSIYKKIVSRPVNFSLLTVKNKK